MNLVLIEIILNDFEIQYNGIEVKTKDLNIR